MAGWRDCLGVLLVMPFVTEQQTTGLFDKFCLICYLSLVDVSALVVVVFHSEAAVISGIMLTMNGPLMDEIQL